ncbi:MAG: argininosuccinate synthase, partial [Planctomycetota bacterium]
YETPGGTILYEAARSLRALTMERDLMAMADKLALEYANVVYTGRWFAPLRHSLDQFFADACKHVTGSVTVELWKGHATAVAATSPYSLYSEDLATFGAGAGYDQKDSKGFVRLYGLPNAVASKVQGAPE